MIPARNLTAWDAKNGTERRTVAVFGESNSMAQGVALDQAWPALVRATLGARYGDAGAGFRSPVRTEWAPSGTVTRHAVTDAYDKGPFRIGYRFSGSANGYTWTNPDGFVVDATSRLLYVDAAGSGSFSINRDGAGWVNAGAATAHDNGLKSVEIGGPVTSTLAVRGANAAGTSAQCDLIGLDVRSGIAGGILVHNAAVSSHKLSGPLVGGLFEPLVHTTAGDALAILDYLDPDVVILSFVADAVLDDVATFRAAYQTVVDRVTGNGGQVMGIFYPEVDPVAIPNQPERNEAELAEVLENDLAMADIFHPFGGSQAAGDALGYFQADNVHFSALGHQAYADVIIRKLGRTSGGFLTV